MEGGVVEGEGFQFFGGAFGGGGEFAEAGEGEIGKAEDPAEGTRDGDGLGTGAGGDFVTVGEGVEDGGGEGDFEGVGEGRVERQGFGGGDFGEVGFEAGEGDGGIARVVLVAAGDIGPEDGTGTEEEAGGFQVAGGLGLERAAELAGDVAEIGVVIEVDCFGHGSYSLGLFYRALIFKGSG